MSPEEIENWRVKVLTWRKEKDRFLATDPRSPIPPTERRSFKGLVYFDPDPNYRVVARLEKYPKPETIVMSTSTGTTEKHKEFGYFNIEIAGRRVRLNAYKPLDHGHSYLFVPFRDRTSGKDSYWAARYLDLEIKPGDEYVIDFNFAYSPYCAYSANYVCPLPPKENWLDIEVRAGEKNYPKLE